MAELTPKEKSGSVGVYLSIKGTSQDWLNDIFEGELFLCVCDKPHKNINETQYVKGVFLKYS